jgi:hypothetical protein
MKCTVLLMCNFDATWLAKSRDERKEFRAEHVLPLFGHYGHSVEARFFDSESFDATVSDFIVLEVTDIAEYFCFIEEIRDCRIVTDGYLHILESFVAVERGYELLAQRAAAHAN